MRDAVSPPSLSKSTDPRATSRQLVEAAASTLIIGFSGTTSSEVLQESLISLLSQGVGGVILFKRNVVTPVQVCELILALQNARKDEPGLLISADQEGGRVARLRAPLTVFPDMAWVGRANDDDLTTRTGEVLARELRTVGFNLNFAPVMDVDSNQANPVIGPRALSHDPEQVSRLGTLLIKAFHRNGILACAKHFPGHGDTHSDSHEVLPDLPHALDRLHALELVPFRAAIAAGVKLIMTAHVRFEALDPYIPATLSRPVLHGLLRETLGYQGVVVSDDLEMKPMLEHYGVAESVRRGIRAGVDAFLICHTLDRAHQAIEAMVKEAERDSSFRHRLLEASARVTALRAGLGPYIPAIPDQVLSRVGTAEHQAVADEVRRRGAPLETAPERVGVPETSLLMS